MWVALAFLFWKKGLYRRFPATSAYLTLRAVFTVLLLAILRAAALPWGRSYHLQRVYFYGYFAMYLASAVLLYFVCVEVFRAALAPFPAIMRIGIVVFRWAAVVSVIVSLTSISYAHKGLPIIFNFSYGLMRSVSVLELCLLAFLGLSMNALRLSVRDMAFGIALGFGIMSTSDFIVSSWSSRITSVNAPVQFAYEIAAAGRAGHLDGLLLRTGATSQADGDAGKLGHLPVERDRLSAGPHGNKSCRAAAREQLLPL